MKLTALMSKKDGHEARNIARVSGLVLGVVFATLAATPLMAHKRASWPMFGQNTSNTASNSAEGNITAKNVYQLKPKWAFTTGGDVSARAAIVGGVAYFPDWAGNIFAVNANSGKLIWSHQLSDYGLTAGTVSRTSPAVVNGTVYIGTQYNASGPTGWLLAINASTGTLNWMVQPDTSNIFPVITSSPVVANGVVYVGMTSNEEFAAAAGSQYYPCCSVSGSVVALNASTGAKLWETFSVPAGYSGGAVWGSNPVVDTTRNTVYVGTGNNYSVPTDPTYTACIAGGGTEASCISSADHADSILALDATTGAVKWATRLMNWGYPYIAGADSWNVDCIYAAAGTSNCPTETSTGPAAAGPDFDFGSAPNEITYQTASGSKTIIGAGQKSGMYYALDPDSGALLWSTQVGPGSSLGGIEWGSASDGTRIYVAICDLYGIPYSAGSAGSWAALDPATGAILWQVADPNGAVDIGPMAVADGVVFADSMGGASSTTAPTMFALDASSGKTLWRFAAGSSVNAGADIVNGIVYWGSGYSHLGSFLGSGNNKFYAFSKNGM
jgi:polyvinyl alcohol dehydrogenase (cytochrome)